MLCIWFIIYRVIYDRFYGTHHFSLVNINQEKVCVIAFCFSVMEFEEKRLFLQVCQFLSYFADKLKEATKQYSLEVLSDSKLLAKRRELMITTILRTVINIFSKCDVLIQNIGRKHFEKLECYNELILFLDVYKKISNKTTDELFHDQCIQTDITNPDAKEFEIDTIVKEEISGYESEETVLIDRDVHCMYI